MWLLLCLVIQTRAEDESSQGSDDEEKLRSHSLLTSKYLNGEQKGSIKWRKICEITNFSGEISFAEFTDCLDSWSSAGPAPDSSDKNSEQRVQAGSDDSDDSLQELTGGRHRKGKASVLPLVLPVYTAVVLHHYLSFVAAWNPWSESPAEGFARTHGGSQSLFCKRGP